MLTTRRCNIENDVQMLYNPMSVVKIQDFTRNIKMKTELNAHHEVTQS